MINQRDLVLVPFPFSDQTGSKVRPVVVISNDIFNETSEDVLVVGVTTQLSSGRYTLPLTQQNLDEGNLRLPCSIKVENILKIDKEIIIKKIGKINGSIFDKVVSLLLKIIQ